MQRGLPVRSPTDRRQPQKSDMRRAAILESLDHHLRDVTRRAGVTRSAFHFYFENKAAAVAALLEPMYDDGFIASNLPTATTGTPRDRIRAMLEALLDTVDQHRYLLQSMLEANATSPAIRRVWPGTLLEFNDPLLERYTVGGRLTRDQLVDRAEAAWSGTLYGQVGHSERRHE